VSVRVVSVSVSVCLSVCMCVCMCVCVCDVTQVSNQVLWRGLPHASAVSQTGAAASAAHAAASSTDANSALDRFQVSLLRAV
jgi:hypothetical protein